MRFFGDVSGWIRSAQWPDAQRRRHGRGETWPRPPGGLYYPERRNWQAGDGRGKESLSAHSDSVEGAGRKSWTIARPRFSCDAGVPIERRGARALKRSTQCAWEPTTLWQPRSVIRNGQEWGMQEMSERGERTAADDTVGEAALGPRGIGAPRALTRKRGGKMSNATAKQKMQ